MRIISKFKDYYDGGMAYGQDEAVVYVRKKEEVFIDKIRRNAYERVHGTQYAPFEKELISGRNCYGIDWNVFVVGFCGKCHIGIELKWSNYCFTEKEHAFCYNIEDVEAFYKKVLGKRDFESFRNQKAPVYAGYFGRISPYGLDGFRKIFNLLDSQDKYKDYFLDNKVPTFVARLESDRIEVTYNQCLKDYDFYRVVDSYTAFQELSMYISGVLGVGEPVTVDVSDECMRDAKGFDDFSFKTKKGYKPNRKRKTKA